MLTDGQRSGQLETRHWSDRIVPHESRMIEKFLELGRGVAEAAQLGKRETAHLDWIEGAEKRAGEGAPRAWHFFGPTPPRLAP